MQWTCAEMTKICPILSYFLESSYFYYIFHTRLILNESAIKSDKLGFGPKALALQTHENMSFKYVHCGVEIILILYPTFKFIIFQTFPACFSIPTFFSNLNYDCSIFF